KGLLLASGQYVPFQDNGLWMNQMPLSYLIPGWIQILFGPGLVTGRMFAFSLSLLAVLGLYLTSRRLGGRWVAALLVWALALNPAAMRMTAMAASQGLVACLLAWTMFLTLGRERANWQLFLGGLLAGVTVMMRINLILLLPLLVLYVFFETPLFSPHFRRSSVENGGVSRQGQGGVLWLLTGILISFGGVHLLYWPNILRLWARWLPLPLLAPFFAPEHIPSWSPEPPPGFRLASFFLAFRYHFAALAGALSVFVFWPKKNPNYKLAIFLSLLLVTFFALHAWAALGNEYCVFCFPTYTAFYSGIGLLLVAATLSSWDLNPPAWRARLGFLALLLLLAGMAYSAEGTVRDLLPEYFYKRLVMLPMPGFGGAQIWQVFANKFGLEMRAVTDAAQIIFPVTVAVGAALLLPLIIRFAIRYSASKSVTQSVFASSFLIITFLGTLFSPSPLLAGEYQGYGCPADTLPGYEAVGAALVERIPPGSKLYWDGYSPVTLLYLPGIQILPGQLHGAYSFRISDDDAGLRRYGWTNQSLNEQWLAESDFVLLEARNLDPDSWLAGQLSAFELVLETAPQSCEPSSIMYLYRRK
ncbi:MAG: glycosyltransferase family 39 protein, partial [Anaerolineae bacterium]|nr:glycosyltransferase family 39 protein [Anaerolineae bacterium]